MAEPLGTDAQSLWTAIWGALATSLALGITALTQHLWKKREASEKPVDYEIASAELADMRPARRLVNELAPKLETMYARLELMVEMSGARGEDIKELSQDHRQLLAKINEVLDLLRAMERQADRDRAVREDREKRGI